MVRKRKVISLFAVAILSLALGTRLHPGLLFRVIERPPGERALQSQLLAASMQVGVGGTIDLAEIVGGDWQWVHLFGGYTSYAAVEQELGFEWTPLSQLDGALGLDDSVDEPDELLVFTKGRTVVAWAVIDIYARPGVVLEGVIGQLSRSEARFVVAEQDPDENGHGSSWILRLAGAWTQLNVL